MKARSKSYQLVATALVETLTRVMSKAQVGLPAELGEAIVEECVRLGATVAHVYAVDQRAATLVHLASRNIPPELLSSARLVDISAGLLAARAARLRDVQTLSNLSQARSLPQAAQLMRKTGSQSMLAAPLIANGRLLGVLTWALSEHHRFDLEEVAYVRSLVAFLALALNNSLLQERLRQDAHLREEWLSVVSHEIKNALGVLSLRIGLAAESCLATCPGGANVAAQLGEAGHGIDIVLRLLTDLTDASLLDAERLPLKCDQTSLIPLIRRCAEAIEGGVSLRLGTRSPLVTIDAVRIEQVLMNLLSNATKYGQPEAPISVRLSAGAGAVRIAVYSGGDALTPEVVEGLFKKYSRARTHTRSSGLGLGLYIAIGIAKAHRGDLRYRHHNGRNVFMLELPTDSDLRFERVMAQRVSARAQERHRRRRRP